MNKRSFLQYIFTLPLFGFSNNLLAVKKMLSRKYTQEILSALDGRSLNYSSEVKISLSNFPGIKDDIKCSLGEQVQIYAESSLTGVSSISIFLEKPNIVRAAHYYFFNKGMPFVEARYKVIENNNVCVVVETNKGLYFNTLYIKTGYRCHY